jgi:hypothetical protein
MINKIIPISKKARKKLQLARYAALVGLNSDIGYDYACDMGL